MTEARENQSRSGLKIERSLSQVGPGEKVRVVSIAAGGRGLTSRLASMGLMVNSEISVINNGHPGPIVVEVRDCRVVLGRGMADKITVVESSRL